MDGNDFHSLESKSSIVRASMIVDSTMQNAICTLAFTTNKTNTTRCKYCGICIWCSVISKSKSFAPTILSYRHNSNTSNTNEKFDISICSTTHANEKLWLLDIFDGSIGCCQNHHSTTNTSILKAAPQCKKKNKKENPRPSILHIGALILLFLLYTHFAHTLISL